MADVELGTLGPTIATAYEGVTDRNQFSTAKKDKLDGIQAGAKDSPTIQIAGSALTKRQIVNFAGAGVSGVDNPGASSTDITIPGSSTAGSAALTTGTAAQVAYTHAQSIAILDLLSAQTVPATAFGIYPDSGADETTRIQNAMLDLANEGPSPITGRKRALYLANGTYLTTGITTTTSTLLVSEGGAVFQFNGTHGANTYILKVSIPGGGSRVTYGMCRGIKLNGLSPANELVESAIWFATASDWSTLLDRVHIFNVGLYGVRLAGATNLLINDFRCDAVGRSAIMIEAEDTRRNMVAVSKGTVTWNDPGGALSRWVSQGYIPSGTVGGVAAYFGAAVLELKHTGSSGGACFASLRDFEVEWHYDGDPAGNGVVLDWNASTNANRPNRLLLENVSGLSDSTTNGHQIVGYRGIAARQPIVTAWNCSLDGQGASLARPIRDFTAAIVYGDAFSTSFAWAGGGSFFSENGRTMFGTAAARPAANTWLDGFSYFATDTGALSFHVNGVWVSIATGGSGGGHVIQLYGTPYPTRGTLNFVGAGVDAQDDAINDRTNIIVEGGGGSTEPASAGDLIPGAIVIAAEVMPYNPVVQSGPMTFALDLANSSYNFGSAVFNFTSDGSALTWNANLVFGQNPNLALASSFVAGTTQQIIITFDESNSKGLVYYGSSTDATKMPLAGGTFTGAVHLGTGASIISDVRNTASGLDLKDHALAFFDAGNVSGAVTLNYRSGTWQKMTAVGNITSITITNVPATGRLTRMWLQIHQDVVGSRLVTFGASYFYPGGTPFVASTGSNKIDVFDVASWDGGTSWLGLTAYYNFGAAPYAPVGVVFNNAPYLLRGGQFTGAVDSTDFTIAFSIKLLSGGVPDQHIFAMNQSLANGYPSLAIGRNSSNQIYIYGANGTTTNLNMISGAATIGQWYDICISVGATAHYLYSNDVSSLTVTTHNNVARDFTNSQNAVGTNPDNPSGGGAILSAELSDLWFQAGLLTDFSITANRRKFFDASNKLVFKGANGQIPTGSSPTLFLAGAANTWQNNLGAGGGMTLTGTLGTSASPPLGA